MIYFDSLAAFWVGGCGQGWTIASGMALDKAAHHLGMNVIPFNKARVIYG